MAIWCGIGAVNGKSIFGNGFITTDHKTLKKLQTI